MSKLQSITESTLSWATERELETEFNLETESTNDAAKKTALSESLDHRIFLTSHQTKGRGRGANHWLDTGAGESLLATWSLAMDSAPQAITGPRVGLAVFHAASEAWPDLAWSLKAPNDLLLAGKKCAGLLVEAVSDGHEHRLLIGFGFNILNHPRKLADATHLAEIHGVTESEWFQFLDVLNSEFEKASVECQKAELSEACCRELASALNANPNLKSKITKVSARGDIVSASGTVAWTDI